MSQEVRALIKDFMERQAVMEVDMTEALKLMKEHTDVIRGLKKQMAILENLIQQQNSLYAERLKKYGEEW